MWRQRADKGVDASPGAPAASADPPASALAQALASAQWAAATVRRLRRESKLPKEDTQAALARLLAAESEEAVKTGHLRRALKASYIENHLRAWGIWPLASFK